MTDEWYYKLRGEVYGPLPFAGILEKGRCGELSLDDAIRQGTEGEWVRVSSIAALFPDLKPAGSGVASETSDAGIDLEEFQDLSELDFESSEPAEPAEESEKSASTDDPAGAAWHARVLGTELGPMSFGDLKLMAEHNELSPDDSVKRGARGPWVPAEQVEDLFSETSTAEVIESGPRTAADGESPQVAASSADEQWYCRVLGTELGPMLFDDLAAIAGNNELTRDDQVRCGPAGEWVAAKTIEGLIVEMAVDADALPAPNGSVPDLDEFEFVEKVSDAIPESEAASPLIETTVPAESETADSEPAADVEQPPAVQQTPVVQQEPATEQAAGVKAEFGAGPGSSPSEMQTPVGSVSEALRRARLKAGVQREAARPRRRRAKEGFESWLSQVPVGVKWGAAVAVALIVVVVMFVSFGGSDQEYYETYTVIWNKHKELRSRSASDDEWSAFNQEVKRQLEPIIHDLKRTAGAKRPIQQHLLWAGRDYLPLLIADARESPSEAEGLFAEHMEDARLLLAGEEPRPPLDGIGETVNARPWERGDFAGEGSGRPPETGDPP